MAMSRERYMELRRGVEEIKEVLKKYRLEFSSWNYGESFGVVLAEDEGDGVEWHGRYLPETDGWEVAEETIVQKDLDSIWNTLGKLRREAEGQLRENESVHYFDTQNAWKWAREGVTLEKVESEIAELKTRYEI